MKLYQLPQPNTERRQIKYWQAVQNGKVIDENNSIALLRHKYGNSVILKSVR